MSTKTCPYCNAAEDPNWAYENAVWFRCGTMIHPDRTNRASQTNQCVEDEVGRLTDQRDQLLQKVQRLEDARTEAAANSLANMLNYEEALRRISELHSECDGYMSKATAWKMHADRLGEAGDAVVAVLRESEDPDFCDWIDKAYDAESKWNQAKETKP